jgi:tetratricopeptide (TPR) repeat protein
MRRHGEGEVAHAELLYRQVLAADEKSAGAWNGLAIALCQLSRLDEAGRAAKQACALRPEIPALWVTRGNVSLTRGLAADAARYYQRAVRLDARCADAHYWLARIAHQEGRLTPAIAAFREALRSASERAEIHFHLARALWNAGRTDDALRAYEQAFTRDIDGALDRRECFTHLRDHPFTSLPEFWHAELIRFFGRTGIDTSRYALVGLRLLMTRDAFISVRAAAENHALFAPDLNALDEMMRDSLHCLLLRKALIAQAEFERLLTRIRATLLLDEDLNAQAPLEFLCALAVQCFSNEFVFLESADEDAGLESLRRAVEGHLGDERPAGDALMRKIATLAMYRPVSDLNGIASLVAQDQLPNAFRELLQRTVGDVLEERRLRSTIPALGAITDAVSQAVRAQYEENPYPRWLSFDYMPVMSSAAWIHAEVPGLEPPVKIPASPKMLVAGSGTGMETLAHAKQIAGVQMLAVDLSLSSLAYAKRMASTLGIHNVEFRQADILRLAELKQEFDIVYCAGVLVAMRDPMEGLRALLPLMRPGGLLKLGLYSRQARIGVSLARAMIREQQRPATPSAMRDFRRQIIEAPSNSPLKSLIRWKDFYSMSECRDFLFHVQEHQFDLPEVAAMVRGAGLTLLGVSKQLPWHAVAAYRTTFPGEAVTADLAKWETVEERFPDTFVGMYQVWCRKPPDGLKN